MTITIEEKRLQDASLAKTAWRLWGPYLSERQWGVVREDYSDDGKAWEYLTHDQSRSRAYRWGEDGIAGISDDHQTLCFALSFWNGKDPILKERLFGLSNQEGNHGEDVKEYYFYLDNLPSHAYMKYLYKYPQNAYPYAELIAENRRRSRKDPEYELMDTKIFDDNHYFDVFVEYAKFDFDDILIKIEIANRGDKPALVHLLPTLWFRNTWSWEKKAVKPTLTLSEKTKTFQSIKASHPQLGDYFFYCNPSSELLFTENESNKKRLFNTENESPYVKDAFHEYIIHGNKSAINPQKCGTKLTAHHLLKIEGGKTEIIKMRLSQNGKIKDPFNEEFDSTVSKRKLEADEFYKRVTPYPLSEDMRNVQRQAFAGLLWNKQCYHYNVNRWLKGDPNQPPPPTTRKSGRNHKWWNLDAFDIFSMPDKWEYPWFASWDLAFHMISFALIDPDFAKHQLLLLTKEWYMHPSGQVPAYEWAFSDVNPPVHAWSALRIYQIEKNTYGRKDTNFLEKIFQKLLLNFTWWVDRKDIGGRNIFEGGFLGLDNIGPFDRSKGVPKGGLLEEPDATGWMGMYCLNLLQIALELASDNPVYEDMATKFFEHFVFIADAINNIEGRTEGLWDNVEGFYYSLLRLDKQIIKMNTDSLNGAVPLFAVISPCFQESKFPNYKKRFHWFLNNHPELVKNIVEANAPRKNDKLLISLVGPNKLKKMLNKILDEKQFLSPYGVRSVSLRHKENPYVLNIDGSEFCLDYEPAESTTSLFGGNSNWRGPIWFPLNYLLIESLQKFHHYLGDEFKIGFTIGSKTEVNLWEVASELSLRLIKIFLKDEKGRRPVYGKNEKFQTDPHFRDYILFHEYFHGDNGFGLGASTQTGWTGLVAKLIRQVSRYTLQGKSPE